MIFDQSVYIHHTASQNGCQVIFGHICFDFGEIITTTSSGGMHRAFKAMVLTTSEDVPNNKH